MTIVWKHLHWRALVHDEYRAKVQRGNERQVCFLLPLVAAGSTWKSSQEEDYPKGNSLLSKPQYWQGFSLEHEKSKSTYLL